MSHPIKKGPASQTTIGLKVSHREYALLRWFAGWVAHRSLSQLMRLESVGTLLIKAEAALLSGAFAVPDSVREATQTVVTGQHTDGPKEAA